MNVLMHKLKIRYIKLHFTLEIMDGGYLPRNKASALRGGMGHALLTTNCIRDEKCDTCDFCDDCLVQRIMYPEMKIRPEFMTMKDSEGYVIECEDIREWFNAGEELNFNLLLFGRTIVYFHQYLQAFCYFGIQGIGREHVRFQISKVTNTIGETLVEGKSIYRERYTVMRISDYVNYRLNSADIRRMMSVDQCRLVFQSPLALKHQGKILKQFHPEALIVAIKRRIFILNCYEGNSECVQEGTVPMETHLPVMVNEKSWNEKLMHSKMVLYGIKGWCDLTDLDETMLGLLIVGELIHIGKNTNLGFGKYSLKELLNSQQIFFNEIQ